MSYTNLQKGRVSLPNHAYHLTIVTQNRQPLFSQPTLANIAVNQLKHSNELGEAKSLTWVVMPDHIHWLLQISETPLSKVIKNFKGRTARAINPLNDSCGTIWQKNFHDHAMRSNENLKETARYIVANPLRAGLVDSVRGYPYWWAIWVDDPAAVFE